MIVLGVVAMFVFVVSTPLVAQAKGRKHSGKTHNAEMGVVQGDVKAAKSPVHGARVTFLPRRGVNRHDRLRRVGTSERGDFHLSLPAGRYAVKVSKPGVGRAVTHVAVKPKGTSQVHVTLHAQHARHHRKH
jgi:hypothetical protein